MSLRRRISVPIVIVAAIVVYMIGIALIPGCATGTGIQSGAVDVVGLRMDKLEKAFETLTIQVNTTNNTQAENIYGGAGWVVASGVGMFLVFALIIIISFRSWLKHRRLMRSKELLTTSIDTLDPNVKGVVTNAIKKLVSDKDTKFSMKDQKNLRQFVDKHKQDTANTVE